MSKPIGQLHPNWRFELFGDELPMYLEFPVKLYARPAPSRKVLPPEKRLEGYVAFEQEQSSANLMSFLAGISWAEKSYGVKGSD